VAGAHWDAVLFRSSSTAAKTPTTSARDVTRCSANTNDSRIGSPRVATPVAAPAFLSGEAKEGKTFLGGQVYMVANSAFSQRRTHTPFLTPSQVPLLSLDLSFPLFSVVTFLSLSLSFPFPAHLLLSYS